MLFFFSFFFKSKTNLRSESKASAGYIYDDGCIEVLLYIVNMYVIFVCVYVYVYMYGYHI